MLTPKPPGLILKSGQFVGEGLNSSEVTRPWAARGTAVRRCGPSYWQGRGRRESAELGKLFDFRATYMLRLRNSKDFPGSDHAS
jgi:hypothetical protein